MVSILRTDAVSPLAMGMDFTALAEVSHFQTDIFSYLRQTFHVGV
jgi:hypothetical protein